MDEITSMFYYRPLTGELLWRERSLSDFKTVGAAKTWNARFANKVAGYKSKQGCSSYIKIQVKGKNYYAHRIIARILNFPEPDLVDHINGDGTDNRECNIRPASSSDNNKNKASYTRNTSGHLGVYHCSRSGKWVATIFDKGERIWLGSFKNKMDAVEARELAEPLYGYSKRHGSLLRTS